MVQGMSLSSVLTDCLTSNTSDYHWVVTYVSAICFAHIWMPVMELNFDWTCCLSIFLFWLFIFFLLCGYMIVLN